MSFSTIFNCRDGSGVEDLEIFRDENRVENPPVRISETGIGITLLVLQGLHPLRVF